MLWITPSTASTLLFLFNLYPSISALIQTSTVIKTVAWNLVFGLPILLSAGLFLTSREAHRNFVELPQEWTNAAKFTIGFVLFLFSNLVYMTVVSFSASLYAVVLTDQESTLILASIPGLAAAAMIATVFVCILVAFLALVFDDWKHLTVAGFVLFTIIAITFGSPLGSPTFSEIALLSPALYYMALAVELSGIKYESPSIMRYYLGIHFQSSALIMPTLVFFLIALFSSWSILKLFSRNYKRWYLEISKLNSEQQSGGVFSEISPKEAVHLKELHETLKHRRQIAAVLLGIIIILTPFSASSYTTTRKQNYSRVVYQSPLDGELLSIGEWLFDSFAAEEVVEANIELVVGGRFEIIDWDSAPSELRLVWDCRKMSLDEFLDLNETERDNLFGGSWSSVQPGKNVVSTGWRGPIEGPEHVWALCFLDADGNIVSGSLSVRVTVEIRAM